MFLILNSIGGTELMLILVVALIFFGAKGLPGIAKMLGRGMRQMKDAQRTIQDEIMNATGDIQSDLRDIKRNFEDNEVTRTVSETFNEKNLRPLDPNEALKDKPTISSSEENKVENTSSSVEPKSENKA